MLSAVKDTFSRLIYSSSNETGGRKRTLEGSVEEEEIPGDSAGEPARKRYRTLTESDDEDQNVIIKRQGSVGLKRFLGGNSGVNIFKKMSSWMSSFSSSADLSYQNGNGNYEPYGNKAGQETGVSTERKASDELDNSSSLLHMHVKKKESMFAFSQMPPISRNSSSGPVGSPISHLLDFPIRPRPELHPQNSVNQIRQTAQQSSSTPKMGGLHNGTGGQEAMSPISPVISPEFRFSPSVMMASIEGRRKLPQTLGKDSKFSKPMKNSPSRKIPLFGKMSGSIQKSSLFNRPGVHSNSKSRFGSFFSRRPSAVQESFRMEDKMRYKEMIQQFNPSQSPSLHAPSFTSAESITTTPSQSRSVSPLLNAIQKDMYSESWTIQKRRTLEEAIKGKPSYLSQHPRLSTTQIASSTPRGLIANTSLPLGASASELAKSKTKPTTNRFLRDLTSQKVDPDVSDLREENKQDAKDSDSESIIVTGEVKKPRSHLNSLEQKLKQSPYYDMNWLKSLNEKHNNFITTNETSASREKNFKKEVSKRREKMVRSKEKEMVRRMSFLDIAYPSKVLELGPEEEELAELTPQMEDMIDVWMRGPPGQQLTEKFNIQITRRDVQTLAGLNWLNDEVINFYMNLLVERGQNNNDKLNVHAFNTFFYPKLVKSGYATIKRWTKKVDVFGQDVLLVPVHLGMHWCLATVDFRDKCVRYYDSMLGDNDRCLQALLEYLNQEHQDKKKSPYNTDDWSLENVKNIPQQMNGSDCGMFACKFAEYLARNAQITFNQEHMPYFRRRMVYEIVTNGLLSP